MAVRSVSTVIEAPDQCVTKGAKTRASCWIKRRYPTARPPVLELQYPGESAASRPSLYVCESAGRVLDRVQQWQRRKPSSSTRRHPNWENGKDSGCSSGILKRTNSWVVQEQAGVSDLRRPSLWHNCYRSTLFFFFFFLCWKSHDEMKECRKHRQ